MSNINNTSIQLVTDLHTVLQGAMAATPAGSKPNSIVSLMMPGQSISEKDFYYPPDNESPDFQPIPGEMSVIVNKALKLNPIYSSTQNLIQNIYSQIIKDSNLPKSREWTADEERKYNEASDYLSKNMATYFTYKDKYDNANYEYWIEKNKKSRNSKEQQCKNIMESIYTQWQASGKDRYEQNLGKLRELMIAGPGRYFGELAKIYDSAAGSQYAAKFLPSDWALNNDNLSWMKLMFNAREGSSKTTLSQEEKEILTKEVYKQTGLLSIISGWFKPSPKNRNSTSELKAITENMNTSSDFKSLNLACDLARVNIHREWMDLGVLAYEGISLTGMKRGAISTGTLSPDNDGIMPSYTSALILAKNIELRISIDNKCASSMSTIIDEKNRFTEEFSCGAFHVDRNSHVTINKSSSSTSDNHYEAVISCPGKQIIGFVNTLVPYFPFS